MDLLAHAITKRPVDQLMLLYTRLSAKRRAHNLRLKVAAIASDSYEIACQALFYVGLDVLGSSHNVNRQFEGREFIPTGLFREHRSTEQVTGGPGRHASDHGHR
jgi:hypothetical protein